MADKAAVDWHCRAPIHASRLRRDDKRDITPATQPFLHMLSQLPGGPVFAAFIQSYAQHIFGQCSLYALRLGFHDRATVLPVVRGSGLISISSIFASRGMRLLYSLKPSVIQDGICGLRRR